MLPRLGVPSATDGTQAQAGCSLKRVRGPGWPRFRHAPSAPALCSRVPWRWGVASRQTRPGRLCLGLPPTADTQGACPCWDGELPGLGPQLCPLCAGTVPHEGLLSWRAGQVAAGLSFGISGPLLVCRSGIAKRCDQISHLFVVCHPGDPCWHPEGCLKLRQKPCSALSPPWDGRGDARNRIEFPIPSSGGDFGFRVSKGVTWVPVRTYPETQQVRGALCPGCQEWGDPGHSPEVNKLSQCNFPKLAGKWRYRAAPHTHARRGGGGGQCLNTGTSGHRVGAQTQGKCGAGSSPHRPGL